MSKPYVPQGTNKRFRVPRTLAADFDAFLENDIPNQVMDFELLHDWYDKFKENYTPRFIRGELYPDSTKSRYENTDNNMNIRCSLKSGIRKGDMVVEPEHKIYILDWNGHKESNNIPSRALECNMLLTVKRYQEAEVDDLGYVIGGGYNVSGEGSYPEQGEWTKIVNKLPCNAYRYDGRPEYVSVSGAPGTIANALTLITAQFNKQTADIHISDVFEWGNEEYEIVDISYVGIDILKTHGTLKLQAKKKAGGMKWD